jgi:hypothetical protein
MDLLDRSADNRRGLLTLLLATASTYSPSEVELVPSVLTGGGRLLSRDEDTDTRDDRTAGLEPAAEVMVAVAVAVVVVAVVAEMEQLADVGVLLGSTLELNDLISC